MKRSWMGFFLLGALLLGSLLVTRRMTGIHDPIEAALTQAAQHAGEEDWEAAAARFRQAEADWKAQAHFRNCFADHGPLEEIDADFEMLKVCCAARDAVSFAGGCLQLARQIAAVGEAHRLTFWNLL